MARQRTMKIHNNTWFNLFDINGNSSLFFDFLSSLFFVKWHLIFEVRVCIIVLDGFTSGSRISNFLSCHIRLLRAHAQESNSTEYRGLLLASCILPDLVWWWKSLLLDIIQSLCSNAFSLINHQNKFDCDTVLLYAHEEVILTWNAFF